MLPREPALTALVDLVGAAYPWTTPVTTMSRRLKLWTDVPKAARPAAFLAEGVGGDEVYSYPSQRFVPKREMTVHLIVYTDGSDPTMPGATILNTIADAIDAAIAPAGSDLALGRNTLGGTVFACRIEGPVKKVPGDLDGDGLLWMQVKLVFP